MQVHTKVEGIRSFLVFITSLLQHVAAPLAAGVLLYVFCLIYGVSFSSYYTTLALLAMMLAAVFIKPQPNGGKKLRLFSLHVGTIASGWLLVIGVLLLAGYATKTSAVFSRLILFSWFLFTPVAILFTQWALQELRNHLMENSNKRKRVVIVGINSSSKALAKNITSDESLGMKLLGFFEDRNPERFGSLPTGQLLGKLDGLPEFVKREAVDTIYIALPIGHLQSTRILMDELQDTTASVYFVPDIFVFDLPTSTTDSAKLGDIVERNGMIGDPSIVIDDLSSLSMGNA